MWYLKFTVIYRSRHYFHRLFQHPGRKLLLSSPGGVEEKNDKVPWWVGDDTVSIHWLEKWSQKLFHVNVWCLFSWIFGLGLRVSSIFHSFKDAEMFTKILLFLKEKAHHEGEELPGASDGTPEPAWFAGDRPADFGAKDFPLGDSPHLSDFRDWIEGDSYGEKA